MTLLLNGSTEQAYRDLVKRLWPLVEVLSTIQDGSFVREELPALRREITTLCRDAHKMILKLETENTRNRKAKGAFALYRLEQEYSGAPSELAVLSMLHLQLATVGYALQHYGHTGDPVLLSRPVEVLCNLCVRSGLARLSPGHLPAVGLALLNLTSEIRH